MNRMFRTALVALSAALPLLATSATTSLADTMKGGSMMSADCKSADAMMMKTPHSDSMMAMKPSGNTDQDFAHMMMLHESAMMAMAKIELKCAKDAKTKQMAQREIDRLNQIKADLDLVLHTP